MAEVSSFLFIEPGAVPAEVEGLIAVIPHGLTDAMQLLEVLYHRLRFPGYFGFNWDALSDCLRDLHWVEERNIVIVHEDLPALKSVDIFNYLNVLAECVQSWKPNEDHGLTVFFPAECKTRVDQLLQFKP